MAAWIPAAISGISSLIGNWMNNRAEKSALQQQNDFNMQQYEDWKYYNSIDEQIKRFNKAGINPQSMSLSNTLPSAYQQQNAVVDRSPFADLASHFGKAFASYYQAKDNQLQRDRLKLDQEYKSTVLKFQEQQLKDLNAYRKQQMAFGMEKLLYSDRWNNRKFSIMEDANSFKREFYTNPNFLGYWNVQLGKQKFDFNSDYNPIALDIAKNKRTQGNVFLKHFDDYMNAQVANMAAQAAYHQAVASKYNELFDDDIATQLAMNAAARGGAAITNSKFARGWNFGMKMLNDVMDVAGKGFSLWKGKGLFVPTSQNNNPYSGYNYNVTY